MAHIGKAKAAFALARRLNPTKSNELIESLAGEILRAFEDPSKETLDTLNRLLDTSCQMPKGALEIVACEGKRNIVPMGLEEKDGENQYKELAIGDTTYNLFVRAPSKKLHVIPISAELYEEFQT